MVAFFLWYYENGDIMNQELTQNDFGPEDTYRLYRTVYEIIHPTISKKNISNYKIMMQDNFIPLRIFYPKKISKIEKVIIYIHGKKWITNSTKTYSEVCTNIVNELDILVIALDYELKDKACYNEIVKKCFETIDYLYKGLKRVGIKSENIIAIADSVGASILTNIITSAKESLVKKQILLYPVLDLSLSNKESYPSLERKNQLDETTIKHLKKFRDIYVDQKTYKSPLQEKKYKNWPSTLIITGDLDPVRDEGIELFKRLFKENKKTQNLNIKFASHGFLNDKDTETLEECFKEIKSFINN